MKVVINNCFGGFSLSRAAVKRMAELQGRPCYFFTTDLGKGICHYLPSTDANGSGRDLFWAAFDIPNPNEALTANKEWHEMTMDERQAQNRLYESHDLDNRTANRTDPLLIQVVEELGDAANGACAQLKIVEIPDGIEWEIDEYDGMETVEEKHRSWG